MSDFETKNNETTPNWKLKEEVERRTLQEIDPDMVPIVQMRADEQFARRGIIGRVRDFFDPEHEKRKSLMFSEYASIWRDLQAINAAKKGEPDTVNDVYFKWHDELFGDDS